MEKETGIDWDGSMTSESPFENPLDKKKLELGDELQILKAGIGKNPTFATEKNPNGRRCAVVTNKGGMWINWESHKNLVNAFGPDGLDWRNKKIRVSKKYQQNIEGREVTVVMFDGA